VSENIRLSAVKFGADGLVPVVTQESRSGDVLMVAYANREALDRTLSTGLAHYFSRSRGRLWQKGETSGHVQRITEVRLDCDGDTVLYRVEQTGPACHTGTRTCFSAVISGEAGRVPSGRVGGGEASWVAAIPATAVSRRVVPIRLAIFLLPRFPASPLIRLTESRLARRTPSDRSHPPPCAG
jgi:phosphoribosyl-AMP cyclohydrolase